MVDGDAAEAEHEPDVVAAAMDVVVAGDGPNLHPLLTHRLAFLDADDAGPYLALELAGAGGVGHDDGVGALHGLDG